MGNTGSRKNREFQAVAPQPQATSTSGETLQTDSKRRKIVAGTIHASDEVGNEPNPQNDSVGQNLPSDLGREGNPTVLGGKNAPQISALQNEDYALTESQERRERMADCEFECSEIFSYLFVGSYRVASDRDLLRSKGITHVINCSAAVVDCFFKDEGTLEYLSLSMVDGRQDDIQWFMCDVIQFIHRAHKGGGKVLLHCEKGISRSCSFAITYRMWCTGEDST